MREEILAAATSLIQRHGFRKITLDDIAKAVGRRKSCLYYYYSGKDELIEAVVRREYETLVEAARRIVQTQVGAAARLRAFILARLREVRQRMEIYQFACEDLHAGGEATLFQKIRATFDMGDAQYIEGLVRQGVESGEFVRLSDEGIRMVSFYALSAQRGLELRLATAEDGWDPFEHVGVAIDVLLRGLARS